MEAAAGKEILYILYLLKKHVPLNLIEAIGVVLLEEIWRFYVPSKYCVSEEDVSTTTTSAVNIHSSHPRVL